jgi:hypothetical protein
MDTSMHRWMQIRLWQRYPRNCQQRAPLLATPRVTIESHSNHHPWPPMVEDSASILNNGPPPTRSSRYYWLVRQFIIYC